ncbi:MAG TPA: PQQ-dependent sugar dehydrogenase [Candidatus Limnocylindrales bacterium]|nr:PQQ-dependent sugar dehydrogenase [Candidatus Limnocylindrales bacterium]
MRITTRPFRPTLALVPVVLATLAMLLAPLAASAASFSISLGTRASGFVSPTQVTNAGDGTNRLFIVEQRGTVRVVQGGAVLPGYFLDIRSLVGDGGERGLLSIAFHPDFETNRTLYAYYTTNGGDILIARFQTNAGGTKVVNDTRRNLLLIEHSRYSNHNGGSMVFGPDGYLYIGTGDGGGAGDPLNNALNKNRLLGKILRIDVDRTGDGPWARYKAPNTNPFFGSKPGAGEIWAYGLRNPWRISFDRATGSLFIADVGQGRYEEIDREPPGFAGGRNYGWDAMEGRVCYTASKCPLAGDTLPVLAYSHASGNCSVTGGHVYRGTAYPVLVGQYVFADFCSGRIWTMAATGSVRVQRADTSLRITSFGESEAGELYLVALDGRLLQVKAG